MTMKRSLLTLLLIAPLCLAVMPKTAVANDDKVKFVLQLLLGNDRREDRCCEPAPRCEPDPVIIRGHHRNHERVVYTRHYEPVQVWVPGRYETREEKVVIPGYWDKVYVAAEYQNVYDRCRQCFIRVLVHDGYCQNVWVPERIECQQVQVWVPGYYVCR